MVNLWYGESASLVRCIFGELHLWCDASMLQCIFGVMSNELHMGGNLLTVQSLNLVSYLWGVLGPFFGDLGLCYGKN